MILNLKCRACDNAECPLAAAYIAEDSEEGCRRKIEEDMKERYLHYMNDVLPFIRNYKSLERRRAAFQEIGGFLEEVYLLPVAGMNDRKGKAVSTPKRRLPDTRSCG